MLNIIEGNLLDIEQGVILHQCNCQGTYGAGIAKQIANKWPQAKQAYLDHLAHYAASNRHPLGSHCCVAVTDNLVIINMLSQNYYGNASRTDRCYTSYDAMARALRNIRQEYPTERIYAPYNIGCGLAGGSWPRVSKLLEQYDITVVQLP